MAEGVGSVGSSQRTTWLPLVAVVLTQIQASFAVNALTVSMHGITTDLTMPATSVGIAITAGTFAMAAFILLGAKVGAKFGTKRVFQTAIAIHGCAMAGVAAAVSPVMLFVFQAASGAVIALIAPAMTVIIATNYHGKEQGRAIGLLAAAIPAAGVLALLIAGTFATSIGWRYSFWLMVALAVINLLLSTQLKTVPAQSKLVIDWAGASLAAVSIILISFGVNGLNSWGIFLASPDAPFTIIGLSPAPVLILLGLIAAQAFFMWLRKRSREHKPRIFDLRVLATGTERAITACMAAMLFVGTAANFLIPLYIQVVQGRSSIETSFSIIPYTISIFVASSFIAILYDKFSPRQIAMVGFVVVAGGLLLLAFTIRGEWSQVFVVIGLVVLGLGQGSIVALVFNTLLGRAPKELAGDVGAWRGLVHNVSGSVGLALASAFAVGVLTVLLGSAAAAHPKIPASLVEQVNMNNANFITNDQLMTVMSQTTATPAQVDAAVAINETARLRALNISLLVLAGIALLAIAPAYRMPNARREGDLPEELSGNVEDPLADDPDRLAATE